MTARATTPADETARQINLIRPTSADLAAQYALPGYCGEGE